ncbi:MAG: response regulator [Candidatus Lokiarchaeota archaeon]|nr:response regulator [Candidatus Lokiarchaeota archaeon]
MRDEKIKVLLIEDNPGDAFLIQEYLEEIQNATFMVTFVDSLAKGIAEYQMKEFDVVLLDLTLPDSTGFDTFREAFVHLHDIPIIILSGLIEELAIHAVQEGAQDYIPKGNFDAHTLYRSIKYAIERNNLQRKLRDSEQQFRVIAENSLMGILLMESGEIKYMNNKMEDITGFTFEEAQLWERYHFAKHIYPDDRHLIEELREDFYNPKSEFKRNLIIRWMKKDSEIIYCEIFMGRAPHLGEKSVLISAIEVTDRILTEQALASETERLSVTLDSIGDAVIATDIYGIINIINPTAEYLTGWPQDTAIGMPLQNIFQVTLEKNENQTIEFMDTVIKTQDVYEVTEPLLLKAKSKENHIIQASASPIKDKDDNIIGMILVFRDITEQRKYNMNLMKVQKLEALGILAGGIAHDFNNILQAILGSISLARLELPAESDASKILFSAEKASVRAKALTNQLLAFAKGGVPVKKPLSLDVIIKETASFCLMGSKNRCVFDIDQDLWLVEGDGGMLSQMINNIVINADQAMVMPNRGTIRINAMNFDTGLQSDVNPQLNGKYVKIEIQDQGGGIPNSIIHSIFDPYFTTKPDGNGLGLTMSFTIAKNHGGTIDVDSKVGKGTKFTIYIPASSETKFTEELVVLDPELQKGKILIMDDEEPIRKILGGMLKKLGYEVEFAENGEEAITKYTAVYKSSKSFLAVIMDLTIPGSMGGKEAIRKLLKIDPNVKAIVSSGYSSDPIMAEFSKFGFIGVLSKPYTIVELQKTLSRSLNHIS